MTSTAIAADYSSTCLHLTRLQAACCVVLKHPGVLQIRAAEALPDPDPGNTLKSLALARRWGWLRAVTCPEVTCTAPHAYLRHLFVTPLGRQRLRAVLTPVEQSST